MADEQNQGNTVVNQGTTIDNLPGLDGLTPAQKQAFIDSSFVPIRGDINGETSTRKVTGRDLSASGENRIDSISLNNVTVQPDDNKNVNIQVASVATTGSYNDLSGKPTDVSSFTNDAGYISESELGDALKMTDDKLCVGYDDDTIIYNSESDELEVNVASLAGAGLAYNGSAGENNLYIPTSDTIYLETHDEGESYAPAVRLDDDSGIDVTAYNFHTGVGGLRINYDPNTMDISGNVLEVKYDTNTITADYDGLTVSNPLPVGDEDSHNQMLICYNDTEPVWAGLGDGLIRPRNNDQFLNVVEAYIGDGLTFDASGAIAITHPMPDPTDEYKPAAAGDVLTYDGDDIVWAAPAAGNGLPEPPEFPANVSGGEVYTLAIHVEKQAPDTYVWSDPYWMQH